MSSWITDKQLYQSKFCPNYTSSRKKYVHIWQFWNYFYGILWLKILMPLGNFFMLMATWHFGLEKPNWLLLMIRYPYPTIFTAFLILGKQCLSACPIWQEVNFTSCSFHHPLIPAISLLVCSFNLALWLDGLFYDMHHSSLQLSQITELDPLQHGYFHLWYLQDIP